VVSSINSASAKMGATAADKLPLLGSKGLLWTSVGRPLKFVYSLQDFLENACTTLFVGPLLRDREVMIDLCGFPKSVVAIVLYELALPAPQLLNNMLVA